jgi:DNA-binding SARP family transcriptional activator
MWGEQLGQRAGKNLQVLVHWLRRSLDDPGRIRHDRSGYALSALTEEVDAWHFADLAEQARRALGQDDLATAVTLQREALALWHGRARQDLRAVDEARTRPVSPY